MKLIVLILNLSLNFYRIDVQVHDKLLKVKKLK